MWATVSARPVEDPLGEPVVGRGVALGVLPGGFLRHVHDAIDASLLGGLGEIRRRLKNAGADGVDEVGPLHSAQRGAHLAEVEQIAVDDLDPPLLEPLRPVILPVGQRPDPVAAGQQFIDRRPAGVARRAGDQDFALNHLKSPSESVKIVIDIQMVGGVNLDVNCNPNDFCPGATSTS